MPDAARISPSCVDTNHSLQHHTSIAPGIVEVILVPSNSPVRIHPFFLSRTFRAVEQATHEMRFHAMVRQPCVVASPHHRPEGRLRRRVSTPIQTTIPCMPAGPKGPTKINLVDADLPNVEALFISTPPRLGSALIPRILFPDSPVPSPILSPILVAAGTPTSPLLVSEPVGVAIQCSTETRESECQTSPRLGCDGNVQTSPRLSEPVTLLDLKKEMQALLAGLCWL
jgi:hypothetical protein